jgi:hypothetical protein
MDTKRRIGREIALTAGKMESSHVDFGQCSQRSITESPHDRIFGDGEVAIELEVGSDERHGVIHTEVVLQTNMPVSTSIKVIERSHFERAVYHALIVNH